MYVCVCVFRQATQYIFKTETLHKLTSCSAEIEKIKARARSLLVIVSTPPTESYTNFSNRVREYNAMPPFNFTVPTLFQKYDFGAVSVKNILYKLFKIYRMHPFLHQY